MEVFLPVVEAAMVYASHYCKASGRSTVTEKDIEYALKYCAMNVVGKKVGSFFPEIYDESESDESDLEVVDDTDEPFTRYQGTEELYVKMNECFDNWGLWEPFSPAEHIIKNAIEKQMNGRIFEERVHPF